MAQLVTMSHCSHYSPVMEFILNNFKLDIYERREVRCKSHIKNEWGTLILPNGTTINPEELQIARFTRIDSDVDIEKDVYYMWSVSAFYVVLHEGELYYLDVDEVVYIIGDPWDYDDNTDFPNDDHYIVPNMDTCNHRLYPLVHTAYCVHAWNRKKEWRKIDMNDKSIENLAKIDKYMKHMW